MKTRHDRRRARRPAQWPRRMALDRQRKHALTARAMFAAWLESQHARF